MPRDRFHKLTSAFVLSALVFAGCATEERDAGQPAQTSPEAEPDGLIAFVRAKEPRGNGDIFVARPNGGGIRQVTRHAGQVHSPAVSPDGRRIAYVLDNQADGKTSADIRVIGIDGTGDRQVTESGGFKFSVQWSPNGRLLAFSQYSDTGSEEDFNQSEIYTMAADGSGTKKLTDNDVEDSDPAWTPDGNRLLFNRGSEDESAYDIWIMSADGSEQRQLTRAPLDQVHPAVSRDGDRVAFHTCCRTEGEKFHFDAEVYTMSIDGTRQRRLTDAPEGRSNWNPTWSPDGSRIAFQSDRDDDRELTADQERRSQIYVIDADGSRERRVIASEFSDSDPSWGASR